MASDQKNLKEQELSPKQAIEIIGNALAHDSLKL